MFDKFGLVSCVVARAVEHMFFKTIGAKQDAQECFFNCRHRAGDTKQGTVRTCANDAMSGDLAEQKSLRTKPCSLSYNRAPSISMRASRLETAWAPK